MLRAKPAPCNRRPLRMTILLYDHPLSPYGQKVKIALLEKGIGFETTLPGDLGSGARAAGFAIASPRGEVPALVDGDVTIFDSTVILEYIADRWPEPALLPAEASERARVRMLEDAMDTHVEAISWGLSEVRNFGRASGELAERIELAAAGQIDAWYQWLESELGERAYFNGDSFGWGDLCVVPFVNGLVSFGFAPDGRLGAWLATVNERPSVVQVTEEAKSLAFGSAISLDAVRELLESGQFQREYRDHRLEWMIASGGLDVVSDGLEKHNIRFTPPFADSR